MRRGAKRLLGALVDAVPALRRRREWGYGLIPWSVLLVNFLFQRVLRLNAGTPWSVHFTSCVLGPHNMVIGLNVAKSFAVSVGCYIQAFNSVEIGDDTIFSFGVGIVSANHDPGNLSESRSGDPVRIGRGCWLGRNATILPGVILGDGCVVGAGAVVTRSLGPGAVLAGVPARPIGEDRPGPRFAT